MGGPATATGVPLEASDALLRSYLDDDLGVPPRDVTSDALFAPDAPGAARLIAREPMTVSGTAEAVRIFALCGAGARAEVADGARVDAGAVLLTVEGPARSILRAERTALNVLGRMAGIATLTAEVQAEIAAVNPRCRVAATRKTTPGFRLLEKRAVVHGGGDPHRYGLYDQVLVKDNHLAARPGLEDVVRTLRDASPGLVVEVEVETLNDAEKAARLGVDIILLDNRSVEEAEEISRHVRAADPRILIEASGGITAETAPGYAPFVDRISMGALTQRARSMDVSLEWS